VKLGRDRADIPSPVLTEAEARDYCRCDTRNWPQYKKLFKLKSLPVTHTYLVTECDAAIERQREQRDTPALELITQEKADGQEEEIRRDRMDPRKEDVPLRGQPGRSKPKAKRGEEGTPKSAGAYPRTF
jgi:hypothetical protein